ncbi:MAG: 3-oxoacyl-ACP reductase [Proteobacteria bacterium]|nr:3-oxoacyl-ACP reductase [Pseudomonadota bacterium]
MNDYLVNLGANPTARQAVKKLGLPVPLPQKLKRMRGPWEERPMADLPVIVHHGKGSELSPHLAAFLGKAGANISFAGDEANVTPYCEHGEAYGRIPSTELPDNLSTYGLVFDGTGLQGPEDLREVYDFFNKRIKGLLPCGRALILSHPPESRKTVAAATATRALDGFMRSMARETGRKGITVNLIVVDPGAEDRIEAAVRFILSNSSAFITGQRIHISASAKAEESSPFHKPLDGKVAMVTGAAQGIGASIAEVLAREGAHVIGMDIPAADDPLSVLANKINGTSLPVDITDPEAAGALIKLLDEKFEGGIDIVVHNAGITRDKTLAKMKPEQWDQSLQVNLISLMNLNEALLAKLRKGGRVICISSVTGLAGNMGQTNYAATKAGIIGYVISMAPTLADKGITINAVAPGFIETKMTAAMPKGTREGARRLCDLFQGGAPEDVAEAVTFLASPGASGMTGEVLRVCGGSFIGA